MRGPSRVMLLVLAGAAALVAVRRLRRTYLVITVEGASMAPGYGPGDVLLTRRIPAHSFRSGDVAVLVASPDALRGGAAPPDAPAPDWMIKRVLAMPRDPVPAEVRSVVPDATVPAGCAVVAGDNRAESYDSRHYGYLPVTHLRAVVVRTLATPHGGRDPDPMQLPLTVYPSAAPGA